MEGVRYLTNDAGEKTHVVLDLKVWSEVWAKLQQGRITGSRRPGILRELLKQANMPVPKHVGDSLLEPMTEEELSDWYDSKLTK